MIHGPFDGQHTILACFDGFSTSESYLSYTISFYIQEIKLGFSYVCMYFFWGEAYRHHHEFSCICQLQYIIYSLSFSASEHWHGLQMPNDRAVDFPGPIARLISFKSGSWVGSGGMPWIDKIPVYNSMHMVHHEWTINWERKRKKNHKTGWLIVPELGGLWPGECRRYLFRVIYM